MFGMGDEELGERAGFGLGERELAGARLLPVRSPFGGEVPVDIETHEVGRDPDRAAIPILDLSLRAAGSSTSPPDSSAPRLTIRRGSRSETFQGPFGSRMRIVATRPSPSISLHGPVLLLLRVGKGRTEERTRLAVPFEHLSMASMLMAGTT